MTSAELANRAAAAESFVYFIKASPFKQVRDVECSRSDPDMGWEGRSDSETNPVSRSGTRG
ncbi:hypothetical protein GCM10025784_06300 [Citricoccus nitrophenolicus]